MASGSKTAVYTAIAANSIVMVAKFAAFSVTGSGAMLSEGIHSLADVGNQTLLAIGIKSASRGPDADHPYGYGREAFVWALISAVGIFFLGCGVTAYHGVDQLLHPQPVEDVSLALWVLLLAFLVEGTTLLIATRAVLASAREDGMSFLRYMVKGSDPMGVAVVLEDSAAVLGVLIAAVAIGLAHVTGNNTFDAIGTLSISALMGALAIFLVRKNRALLLGQAVLPERQEAIMRVLESSPLVETIDDVKATVTGSGSIRFKAEIEFNGAEVARRWLVDRDIGELRAHAADDTQFEAFLIEYGDHIIEQLGDEIDGLEARIIEAAPQTAHVDLEAD